MKSNVKPVLWEQAELLLLKPALGELLSKQAESFAVFPASQELL